MKDTNSITVTTLQRCNAAPNMSGLLQTKRRFLGITFRYIVRSIILYLHITIHITIYITIYLILIYSCCKCPGHQIVCKNHCLNKCDDRKVFHGRILFLEGSLHGARANVSCDGGFHVRDQSICIKTETVQCIKSKYGCDWRSHTGLSIPSCDRMGKLQ